jgi:hypothetical protein
MEHDSFDQIKICKPTRAQGPEVASALAALSPPSCKHVDFCGLLRRCGQATRIELLLGDLDSLRRTLRRACYR